MEKIKIKDYLFEIDKSKTQQVHDTRTPATIECGCGNCLYFNTNKQKLFSKKSIYLLRKFGLDYKKEDYFANYGEETDSPYEIAYYVRGKILKKGAVYLNLSSNISIYFEDQNFAKNFLPEGLDEPYFLITIWIK